MYSQRSQQSQQPQQPLHYPPVMDTSYNPSLGAYTGSTIVRHNPLAPPPPPHQPSYAMPAEPAPNASETNIPPLTIPELSEFASMMVYLMWHARRPSVMALHDLSKAITNTQTGDYQLRHSKETASIANRTSAAFKKFSKQVLTATQLSESVILLALKYIAMLLQFNPSIQGAEGSEYRLFTVALMLGNKFLDDNTFTNKTWSEVTGMKVKDLNVMELEFLDVLKFKLFVQKEEFERWKAALLLFRHQLLNADGHLLEEAFKGIVDVQQQQNQQQQYQLMLILSKAQLPHFPTQPLERPLARVPLRIPLQPVWRHQQQNVIPTPSTTNSTTPDYYHYPNSATSTNSYNTNYQPQPPQQAPQQPTARPMGYNNYYPSTPTVIDSYYSNNRPPPSSQSTNSYYNNEPLNDYTPTELYPRTNGNSNYTQTYLPPQPYTNGQYRRSQGPVQEDPMTAMDSYRNHLK